VKRLFFHQFKGLYRISRWFRVRFTDTGVWVLAAMLMSVMIGINTRISFGSQIFAFLTTALVLDGLFSFRFKPKITIKRVLPLFTTSGELVRYHFRVTNVSDRAEVGIAIQDELSRALPSLHAFKHEIDPNDAQRNWFDRKVGYPKWLWLIRQKRGADTEKGGLIRLQAGETLTIEAHLTSLHRGLIQFQGYLVTRPGPFGLFNAICRIPDHNQLLVLPKRYAVSPLNITGHVAYQPGGVVTASTIGNADEFFGLRDYHPGDSKRDIHWKSWAKVGKPIVKEYRPEFLVRHALILDTAVPIAQTRQFEVAVSIAASFICTLDTKESLLDLIFIGHRAFQFTMGQGLMNSRQLLKVLATVNRRDTDTLDALHTTVMSHAEQLSGCMLVLTRWDQARQHLYQQLLAKKVFTVVLLITDQALTQPMRNVITISPDAPEAALKKMLVNAV